MSAEANKTADAKPDAKKDVKSDEQAKVGKVSLTAIPAVDSQSDVRPPRDKSAEAKKPGAGQKAALKEDKAEQSPESTSGVLIPSAVIKPQPDDDRVVQRAIRQGKSQIDPEEKQVVPNDHVVEYAGPKDGIIIEEDDDDYAVEAEEVGNVVRVKQNVYMKKRAPGSKKRNVYILVHAKGAEVPRSAVKIKK